MTHDDDVNQRRRLQALAAVITVAAGVYALRLGQPSWQGSTPRYVFDEKYTAFTANRLVKGDPVVYEWAARRYQYVAAGTEDLSLTSRSEWTSPPGAPLAVAPFVAAFGFSEVSTRAASVVAALIALVATASLAGGQRAWLACGLVAFDGAFFVLARTAMPYMFLVAGMTSGAALVARAVRRHERRWLMLLAAGLAFGFGIAVRLTGIPLTCAILAAVAISREGTGKRFLVPSLVVGGIAAATYFASYLPFLAAGHTLADLLEFHQSMAWFHAHVPRDFPQGSRWYTWPLAMTPVIFAADTVGSDKAVVWVVGGRLLWWAVVPALALGLWWSRTRELRFLLPTAAVAAVWFPWGALDRFALFYYLLPALPFAAILASEALQRLRARWIAPAYLTLSVLLFVMTYPVLAAVSLPAQTVDRYEAVLGIGRPRSR